MNLNEIPFANLDQIEGVDGYPKNLSTFNQIITNARLIAMSRFKWELANVKPIDFCGELIEQLLFLKGQCALWDSGDGWVVRQCVPNGINEFGMPERFTLTDLKGGNMVVVDSDDERVIWIKNNAECIPTNFWILKYANRVAKIERTMDLNIDAQKTPYIIETSPEVHLSIQNIFKQIREMDEVVYVDQKSGIKDNVKVLDLNVPYLVDQLYAQKTNEYNDLLNFLGLNTVRDKKERLLYNEAIISDELTDTYLDLFAAPRIRALKQMRQRGLDVKLMELKVDTDNDGAEEVSENRSNVEIGGDA